MKPPQLFRGQPVWVSLLVLVSYLVFGPLMDDDGPDIKRPHHATRDWCLVAGLWFILTLLGFTIFSYLSLSGLFLVLASTSTSLALTLVVMRKSVIRILVNSGVRLLKCEGSAPRLRVVRIIFCFRSTSMAFSKVDTLAGAD